MVDSNLESSDLSSEKPPEQQPAETESAEQPGTMPPDAIMGHADPQPTTYPYTIQIGSYDDRDRASRIMDLYRGKGDPLFSSFIVLTGKGAWHRVFWGCYENAMEAQAAAKKLKARRFRNIIIAKTPYALEMGTFEHESEANAIEQNLLAKGHYPYRLASSETGIGAKRVLIGAFRNPQEAFDYDAILKAEGFEPKLVLR